MKTFISFRVLLLLACLMSLTPFQSKAGVLLTKEKQAEIGNLTENETALSLQTDHGAVEYKKDTLLWYSIQADIDSLLKAGQKAKNDQNLAAAISLFELSIAKEPSTQAQAQTELDSAKAIPSSAPTTVAAAQTPATEQPAALTPPENGAKTNEVAQATNADASKSAEEKKEVAAAKPDNSNPKQEAVAKTTSGAEETELALEVTKDEQMASYIAGGIFIGVVLGSLWQIAGQTTEA